MTDLLHRLAYSYKKPKVVPGKADRKAQKNFIRSYKRIKAVKGGNDPIYFMDGTQSQHNSVAAYGWIKKGAEKEIKSNSGRQRLNIKGAINIESQKMSVHYAESINAQSTIALLKKIEAANKKDYQNLLLSIEEEIKEEGLNWKVSPTHLGVQLDPVIEMKRKHNICFSCFDDPYINVDGLFNFCPRQEYNAVVDISVGFEKAWNHPALLKFRKNMLNGLYPRYCGMLCFLNDKSLDKKREKGVLAGSN